MVSSRQIKLFEQALLACDRLAVHEIFSQLPASLSPIAAIESLVVPSLERLGLGWENGTVALSQVYMGSRICEEMVDTILPAESPERCDQPSMAIALLDDYHSLGKTIVYSILRASGFELQDYGRQNAVELVRRVTADDIKILLISTLMLPSALQVKEVCDKLRSCDVRVVVGGAPFRFDSVLWQQVGADAMGATASDAIDIVHKFAGEQT